MSLLSSYSLVSFDVDGTIIRNEVFPAAIDALGLGEKWRKFDDMFRHNRISLRQHFDGQLRLFSGLRIEDVLGEVSKLDVIANVRETVVKLQGHGLGVILLTASPDFLCAYLVERFGFNGYVASKVGSKEGHLTDDIIPMTDKRDGLRKYCNWLSLSVKKCIHIGDGLDDISVFRVVGHSIALNSRFERVRRVASKVLVTENLLDVYNYLSSNGTESHRDQ